MHITPAQFLQYSQINPYNYYQHYTLVKYLRSVQTSYCILSISGILELHKSKTWGIPGYPHIPQWAILAECRFNLVFRCTASQITNIHFAWQIPLTITRHSDTSLCRGRKKNLYTWISVIKVVSPAITKRPRGRRMVSPNCECGYNTVAIFLKCCGNDTLDKHREAIWHTTHTKPSSQNGASIQANGVPRLTFLWIHDTLSTS